MEQRLSLVTLAAADVAASRRFYERLGWKASSIGGDEVAFFHAGGMVLAFWGRDDLAKDSGLASTPEGCAAIAIAHNVRRREDVDAVLAEVKRAGARILKAGEDKPWGGHVGYFTDPDGHLWEVTWNPGFTLTDDGSLVVSA